MGMPKVRTCGDLSDIGQKKGGGENGRTRSEMNGEKLTCLWRALRGLGVGQCSRSQTYGEIRGDSCQCWDQGGQSDVWDEMM